jgi:acetoacetate decarboxylase
MPLHNPPYVEEWENPDCTVYSYLCHANPKAIAWALAPTPFMPFGDWIEVSIFDQSNHTYGGYETGIAIPVRYKRHAGSCFVQHYVTSDMALMCGREFFGYPKLLGDVRMKWKESQFRCTTKRRGSQILTITGQITDLPSPDPAELLPGYPLGGALFGHLLQLKAFPMANRPGAEIRQVIYRDLAVTLKDRRLIKNPKVELSGSEFDPLERFLPLKIEASVVLKLGYGGGWRKETRKVLADLKQTGRGAR